MTQFNNREPISALDNTTRSLYLRDNYFKIYEKEFVKITYSEEIKNGIFFSTSLEYANRNPLFNTSNYSFAKQSKNAPYASNNPVDQTDFENAPFTAHKIATLNIGTTFIFNQKYLSYPDRKFNMGNEKAPSLAVNYRKNFGASNAALNSTVENVYGPTEATIHLTRRVYSKDDLNRVFTNGIMPIGKPFSDHEIEIINRDGNKVSYGDTGEIVLKGPQITQGYLNDVEKTKSAFVHFDWDSSESKWYKSGDFGFYNTDGDLECLGRKDNQIKIGGQRIEIGEIEGVLRNYELLNDVVIVLSLIHI